MQRRNDFPFPPRLDDDAMANEVEPVLSGSDCEVMPG